MNFKNIWNSRILTNFLNKLPNLSKKWQLRLNEKNVLLCTSENSSLSTNATSAISFCLASTGSVTSGSATMTNCVFGTTSAISLPRLIKEYIWFSDVLYQEISIYSSKHLPRRYVRPLLEYRTPLWSPHLIKDIAKIENVQRYFTRRLLSKSDIGYTGRLKLLGLDSLELRRLKFDLMLYYQIINELINLNCSKFYQILPVTHETRSHKLQIQRQVFQNNSLNNTFPNRAVDCWNSLRREMIEATDFKTFKRMLNVAHSPIFYPYMKL